MIIRVELHSAITGQITEIERARITNIGRSETPETLRGPCAEDLNRGIVQRSSFSEKHPRNASTSGIWSPKLSKAWGYGE
jgi:hypothetical protein